MTATPANTNARRLRETAREYEQCGMFYFIAAVILRANADREWPQ